MPAWVSRALVLRARMCGIFVLGIDRDTFQRLSPCSMPRTLSCFLVPWHCIQLFYFLTLAHVSCGCKCGYTLPFIVAECHGLHSRNGCVMCMYIFCLVDTYYEFVTCTYPCRCVGSALTRRRPLSLSLIDRSCLECLFDFWWR